ncbi:MAG TPA: zf-HC2 domain-containing protein [Pyrinomonadaceae bacterium]
MNETVKIGSCERGNDLVSFLYGEAEEHEARDFERHLQACRECRHELKSFGFVRESIAEWKDEALAGFVPPQIVAPVRQKSAFAALREFFDLSPLWLKGAVGFAAILLCVLAIALVMAKQQSQPVPTLAQQNAAKYTEQQLQDSIQKALQEQQQKIASVSPPEPEKEVDEVKTVKPKESRTVNRSTQWGRHSLSKSEREQLATDLRLLSTDDDDDLSLIGERINQEF